MKLKLISMSILGIVSAAAMANTPAVENKAEAKTKPITSKKRMPSVCHESPTVSTERLLSVYDKNSERGVGDIEACEL